MRYATIERCAAEAKRFLSRVDDAKKQIDEAYLGQEKLLCRAVPDHQKTQLYGGKSTAALHRASLDLTRALADLRQGR